MPDRTADSASSASSAPSAPPAPSAVSSEASHAMFLHPYVSRTRAETRALVSQAVARIVRPGQTRPVTVWTFLSRGTCEEALHEQLRTGGHGGPSAPSTDEVHIAGTEAD